MDGDRIKYSDIRQLFMLFDKLNSLMHQSESYLDPGTVEEFSKNHYATIRRMYYEVLWDALTPEDQVQFENEGLLDGVPDKRPRP